jgi:hypothetical protein
MPRIQPIDTYLDEVSRIRSLPGTRETSYYPAVANLLNRIGGELKPKVYCLHHPSGGDGIPDFGLFEQTLFRRGESPEWRAGIAPIAGSSRSREPIIVFGRSSTANRYENDTSRLTVSSSPPISGSTD